MDYKITFESVFEPVFHSIDFQDDTVDISGGPSEDEEEYTPPGGARKKPSDRSNSTTKTGSSNTTTALDISSRSKAGRDKFKFVQEID